MEPIRIYAAFRQEQQSLGVIGRTGEHEARRVEIDCADVLKMWPDAEILCVCRRPCDMTPYPLSLTAKGDTRMLLLTRRETAASGTLKLELRAVQNDTVLKSALLYGQILSSLTGQKDAPDTPLGDALNRLDTAISDAKHLTDEVQERLDNGELRGEKGDRGEQGEKGEKGEKGDPGERGANGADAPQIDDNAVSANTPWSSQRIVNTLCQEVTASGNPVACTPVKDSPLGIKVSWEPTQAGSGTPSPTNARPIMGRNQVALTVNGEAHTLTLPHVVYGGSVDVVTGEVTEEYALFKSSDARLYTTNTPSTASNWVSAYYMWEATAGKAAQEIKFCNALPVKIWDFIVAKESIDEPYCWYANSSWGIAVPRAQLPLADDASQQEILNAIQSYADELGLEIAYTLATPTHYQITGIGEVTALDGANTISTDADQVTVTWREAVRAEVKDVQVNGTSILAKGVANVPVASKTAPGVVGVDNYSIGVTDANRLFLYGARKGDVNTRASNIAIDPIGLDYAVKAAMCDGKGAAWTAAEQAAARDRMGLDKPWELIEEVEFAEEAMFLRTQEPDGTPYNFAELILKTEFPPTSKAGNIPLYFVVGALRKNINSYFINPRDATSTKYGFSKVWRANQYYRSGWWTCVRNVGEYAAYYENPLTVDKLPISEGNIIEVTIGVALDAGTKIRIYGVRA